MAMPMFFLKQGQFAHKFFKMLMLLNSNGHFAHIMFGPFLIPAYFMNISGLNVEVCLHAQGMWMLSLGM